MPLLLLVIALCLALPEPALSAELDPSACVKLRSRLRTIDSRGRQRSTPALAEQRRKVKSRLYRLRCSEIPKPGER